MDGVEVVRGPPNEIKNVFKSEESDKDSVDNFQKFIYELFEKNGILNDLRAYLRRHIVDVLRSSHTGDPPICQKNFSHRLELKSQAMNILVAEYLLRAEFNYTLSVFVSELPLPNMVFDFASNLMKGSERDILHFKDKDVWSIINYLGMKCDTSFVTHILEMYKNEEKPLLSCLIQSFPFPTDLPSEELGTSSDEVVFSDHTSNSLSEKTSKKYSKFKCQHYAICKGCHSRVLRLREKYKKKKDAERVREPSFTSMNLKSVMKNLDVVEDSIVNEMFEQLKGVFEAEVDLIRAEHERHEQQRQQHQQHSIRQQQLQMEEAFKAREEELERGVRAKKKFLWGLARSLRAQHDQLARAMTAVKFHSQRLKTKEEDLKTKLEEVEKMMTTRGADLQAQVSSELVALEGQLDSVKRERQAVNKEKSELEQLRQQITANHAKVDVEEIEAVSDKAWSNYDLLKNELSVLRKYIESSRDEPKCVVERSTVTDVNAQTVEDKELFNTEQFIRNPELLKNEPTVRTPDMFKNQPVITNPEMFNNEHITVRDTELFNNEQFIRNPQLLNNEQNARNLQQLNNEHNVRETDPFNSEQQFIRKPQLLNNEHIVRNLQLLNNEQAARTPQLMNNEQNKTVREEDNRFKNNQLINDLKKLKNVNFCVCNAEESAERPEPDALALLKQENERLREYARQQEQRVSALQAAAMAAAEQRLPAPAPPPRAPPPRKPRASTNEVPMTSKLGWRCKGAGEETTLFTCTPPRVFVPGETVPFIGLLHDRHDSKRLMNQWRAARRSSPLRVPRPAPPPARRDTTPPPAPAPHDAQGFTYPSPGFQIQSEAQPNQQAEILTLDSDLSALGSGQAPVERANSPKSVLREAKEKLRTKPARYVEPPPSTSTRDKSPATVLREAKLRLRKLEIEAEAVEQSYLDYRKRQTELRSERELSIPAREEAQVTKDVDDLSTKVQSTFQRLHQRHRPPSPVKSDLHAYLQEYNQKLNLSETQFSNRNTTAAKVKPIPVAYSCSKTDDTEINGQANNYLDTPLEDFQRFYKPNEEPRVKTPEPSANRPTLQPRPPPESPPAEQPPIIDTLDSAIKQLEARKDALIKVKNSKKCELEILKQNITKIYYVLDNDIKNNKKDKGDEVTQDVAEHDGSNTPSVTKDKDNVLSIEVETGNGRSEMKIEAEPKELLVVVQSETAGKPEREGLRGDMTVLISPKRSPVEVSSPKKAPHCKRSVSPEQAAKLTRNDVLEAIYHADPGKVNSNEEVTEEVSKGNLEDAVDATDDDFSADVDNYDLSRTHSSWDTSEYYNKIMKKQLDISSSSNKENTYL